MCIQKNKSFFIVPALAWIIYVFAYMGRMNLSITIPYLQSEFGYSKAAIGFLASGFFCTYAVGQLINGMLGDRIPVKYFVSLGLIVAGISNIVFGIVHTFPVLFLAWSANGYFQSMLWGPLLRTISESVPQNKLYRATFLMSTSPTIGRLLSYVFTGRLAVWKWEAAFLLPGTLLIMAAGVWYCAIPMAIPAKQMPVKQARTRGKELINFFINSKIYLMILLGVLIGVIREGLTFWGPVFFIESYSLKMEKMLFIMSFVPLVNLLFIITAGILIKKYLKNEKAAILMFLLIALLPILLIWRAHNMVFPLIVISFYVLTASISTVNNQMTSYLPFGFAKYGKVSAAAGIIDSSFYLGATIAGPLIGITAESFGWNGIFGGILGICAAALIPGFFLRRGDKRR